MIWQDTKDGRIQDVAQHWLIPSSYENTDGLLWRLRVNIKAERAARNHFLFADTTDGFPSRTGVWPFLGQGSPRQDVCSSGSGNGRVHDSGER